MTSITRKVKSAKIKALKKRVASKSRKNPSSFFGKLKDGVDGLTYQKKLRDEWK